MADIFLSYARDDAARAEQVARSLESAGYDVFWDTEIPPGSTWADYLEAKLSAAKVLLVLWSKASTQSQWVREEARIGRDKGKLLPVLLDGSPPPFGFGEVQAADLSDWNGQAEHPAWKRLLSGLQALITRDGSPAPQPRPAPPPPSPPSAGPGWRAAPAGIATTLPDAPVKKGPPWWVWVGGTVVALALIGLFLPSDNPPGSQSGSTSQVATDSRFNNPPGTAVQGALGEAAESEARAAMERGRANALLGQQAAAAAMAGQTGYGTSQGPGGAVAGEVYKIPLGQPAAVGAKVGDQGEFYGQLHATAPDAYSLDGSVTVKGGGGSGKWVYQGSRATFVGGAEIANKYSWLGKEEGDTVNKIGAGVGVVRYPDGSRFAGAYKTVGEGATMQLFRHGVGVLYNAKGEVEAAGTFQNDDYVGPG
jgi:hypothetical protein